MLDMGRNTIVRSITACAVVCAMMACTIPVSVKASTPGDGVYGKVTKITATMIYLKGSYLTRSSMTWQVATNSKTKYYNAKNKLIKRTSIRIGEYLSAIGHLVSHTYRIINVTEVDDLSR